MKILKRVISTILFILLSLLFIYNIYNFICISVLKHKIAPVNGYVALDVVSGSMEPTIHIGDMIIINTKDKDYEKDDIVTFYDQEGSLVTHRIIAINSRQMITKGDNNNSPDPVITHDKIVGKYVLKINNGRKIVSALKSPFAMIIILIIGILMCVFVSINKNGEIILDDKEREYLEFKKYQKNKKSRR